MGNKQSLNLIYILFILQKEAPQYFWLFHEKKDAIRIIPQS
jgi:hypothetical protein